MSADAVVEKVELEYLLTIRVKFQAVDDPAARIRAKTELVDMGIREEEMKDVKFQRLRKDGPPEKVEL